MALSNNSFSFCFPEYPSTLKWSQTIARTPQRVAEVNTRGMVSAELWVWVVTRKMILVTRTHTERLRLCGWWSCRATWMSIIYKVMNNDIRGDNLIEWRAYRIYQRVETEDSTDQVLSISRKVDQVEYLVLNEGLGLSLLRQRKQTAEEKSSTIENRKYKSRLHLPRQQWAKTINKFHKRQERQETSDSKLLIQSHFGVTLSAYHWASAT